MRALLEIPCRIGTLQNTWNARTPVHERFSGPVRLLHGRHADFETVARNINITSDVRVWIPKVNLCLYDRMSMSHQVTYFKQPGCCFGRSRFIVLVGAVRRMSLGKSGRGDAQYAKAFLGIYRRHPSPRQRKLRCCFLTLLASGVQAREHLGLQIHAFQRQNAVLPYR